MKNGKIAIVLGALTLAATTIHGTASIAMQDDGASDAQPRKVYLTCKRDGQLGKPAAPLACMSAHEAEGGQICSGEGDAKICETSLFSLCKSVGDAAGRPMNDQGGKGMFPDRASCMAKCNEEEAAWGRLGGTCEGDITPQ